MSPDLLLTTSQAVLMLRASGVEIDRHHIKEWSRPRPRPRIRPAGWRGRERLWRWSELLAVERETRARRTRFVTSRDVPSKCVR